MSNASSVEALFFAVLELETEDERIAYLDSACGGDVELRKQVDKMLNAHPKVGDFLNKPAGEQLPAASEPFAETQAFEGSKNDKEVTLSRFGSKKTNDDEDDAFGFLEPSTRTDSLGRIGHYEVLEVLGKGGFGIVFRAFDDTLQRVVALKVMAPQLAVTSPARKRFLREARSSAQVRHENVVQVYEVGETPLPYLSMEFIPGETLQQKLDRTGPLEVPDVLRIGGQIAEGLAAAHSSELIHRDIKPGNILLEGGTHKAKITDFGLARAADDASISQSGVVAGTPMYMAPEQAQGEKLDQRADLFSLGSVLYQMVSGRPPFRANNTVAVLKRVAEDTPRDIREIIPETPQWLCDIIAKLHAKNPDERFQSAREVADVLADCESQLTANSKLKDYSLIPSRQPKQSGRTKWVAAAAVLLLPLIALVVTEFAGVTHLFLGKQSPVTTVPKNGPNADPKIPNAPGRFALAFDGRSNWVEIPSLRLNEDHALTVEAWVALEQPVDERKTYDVVSATKSGFGLGGYDDGKRNRTAFLMHSGKLDDYVGAWEKQPAPRRKPVHLAGVYDGKNELRFYVDGHLQERAFIQDITPSTMHLSLGGNLRGGSLFLGRMYKVRISKIARYDTGFTPGSRWKSDADTIALYHFDEGKGDTLKDSSGHGHDGKIFGAKWVKADGSPISPSQLANKEPVPKKTLLGFHSPVYNVTYSPDGRLLAAAGKGAVRVYDAESGELRYALNISPQTSYYAITFSPDSRHLLTAPAEGAADFSISIWEATTGELTGTLVGHQKAVYEISFSSDGKRLISCGHDHAVRLWDFPSRKLLSEIRRHAGKRLRSAVFSSSGMVALGGDSYSVYLFDMNGKLLKTINKDAAPLCFSPDGKRLAGTNYFSGIVTVWDVDTGSEIASWRAHEGHANGVAFSPDGKILVTAGGNNKVRLWDVSTQRELAVLSHAAEGYWVAFSPDGKTLATTGYDQVVKLWDVPAILATATVITPFTDADVKRIAALPAGQQIEEIRKELMRRNPSFDGKLTPEIQDGKVTGLRFITDHIKEISPVRALSSLQSLSVLGSYYYRGSLADLAPLQGMSLTYLNANFNKIQDLTPLKGLPLKHLYLMESPIADLAPLRGMALESLYLDHCSVSDLTPLQGMPLKALGVAGNGQKFDLALLAEAPLEFLNISNSKVSDLSPTKGMPLKTLYIYKTWITDLSPLKGMRLEKVFLSPAKITKGLDILRDMKTLRFIGIDSRTTWPAAEFWERYDKGELK